MSELLSRFWRKQARRAARIGLPLSLGLALMVFSLVQLQSANTLWYQEVQINGSVGTGTFEKCKPYVVTYNGATAATGGNTTFTYTFSGGGPKNSGDTCKNDISYIAIQPACFNPELVGNGKNGGDVISTTQPGGWTYNPANGKDPKQVKWDGSSVGTGPFNLQFSFTLPGTSFAMIDGQFEVHAGKLTVNGDVKIPQPASCGANKLASPNTSMGITSLGAYDGSGAQSDAPVVEQATPTRTPSPTPTPTNTPTPTPTPRFGVSTGGNVGSYIPAQTPTPKAGE